MRFPRLAGAAALGIVLGFVAVAAAAAPRTVYDPSTHRFLTYDPDKLLRDARGPAPRGPQAPAALVPHVYPKPDAKFDRQVVAYDTTEAPGTIVIDTAEKFLYYVMEDGQAIRMGVGVGREGFGWTGVVHVGAKQEAPKWFPPDDMVARQPELAKYQAEGMPGGEGNPLGVRALYLFDDKGKDTLYRIHGTIEPNSIGLNVSSGCIRMLNENVTELYDLVDVGTKVIVM
jgi:lipoprotein-anchoring transpeptidase ErfK/SrfK